MKKIINPVTALQKVIGIIASLQKLGIILTSIKGQPKSTHGSVAFLYCDDKSACHDFRVKESYEGVVVMILESCGYDVRWDNDEVCRFKEDKVKVYPILVVDYSGFNKQPRYYTTTSDKILDVLQQSSGRYDRPVAIYELPIEPIVDLTKEGIIA